MCRPNIARNVFPSESYQLSRVVFRGTKGLVASKRTKVSLPVGSVKELPALPCRLFVRFEQQGYLSLRGESDEEENPHSVFGL